MGRSVAEELQGGAELVRVETELGELVGVVLEQVRSGLRRVVPGVLDHGGIRALIDRSGQIHRGGQLGAVAGLYVGVARFQGLALVEVLFGQGLLLGGDDDLATGDLIVAVAGGDSVGAGFHLAEDERTVAVGLGGLDRLAALVEQGDLGAGLGSGDGDLSHAGPGLEGGLGCIVAQEGIASGRAAGVVGPVSASTCDECRRRQAHHECAQELVVSGHCVPHVHRPK